MTFILATPGEGGGGMHVPRTVQKNQAAGSSYSQGALLIVNASNEYAEAGVDPAIVAAIALNGAGADASGFNRLGTLGFPPGTTLGTTTRDTIWHAEYEGSLPANAVGNFGVIRSAGDGKWRVDFAETVNTRVSLVTPRWADSPFNRNRVFVRFLDANVGTI